MTIFGVELAHPGYLIAALAVIPIVLWSRRAAGRVIFSSLRALPHASTWRTELAWLPDAFMGLAALALAIALAGPRKGDEDHRIRREGIAIMMVVDASGSMQALDLSEGDHERTRLDAVKQAFEQFVLGDGDRLRGRPDDAIGLVSFARYADTRSPLTLDHDNLVTAARQVAIVTDPNEDGTAVGDGLAQAVERLRAAPQPSKVAIVLTDGVSNAGEMSPLAAANLAHDAGVKVYTIGAGTNGRAPIRVQDPFGNTQLRSMPVQIDEKTLGEMAAATGGRYFRATDASGLRQIYGEIDRLTRVEISETQFSEHRQFYVLFVVLAMVAMAAAVSLRSTWLRRLP